MQMIRAVVLTACLPGTCVAHVGRALSPAFEVVAASSIDVHDGSLSDWEGVAGPLSPSLTKEQAAPLNTGADFGVRPMDLEFNWFFAWSAEPARLYFAAQVFDDVYLRPEGFPEDELAFQYDSLELMVDGDHSGGPYAFYRGSSPTGEGSVADSSMVGVQAQHYMLFPASPVGARMRSWPMDSPWISRPPYGDAGGGVRAPSGPALTPESRYSYLVEGYVTPWDSLDVSDPDRSRPTNLRPGSIIGLQVSVSDCDAEPNKCHGYFTLYGATSTWRMAQRFVDLELVGVDETAIVSTSWARIKASLRTGK